MAASQAGCGGDPGTNSNATSSGTSSTSTGTAGGGGEGAGGTATSSGSGTGTSTGSGTGTGGSGASGGGGEGGTGGDGTGGTGGAGGGMGGSGGAGGGMGGSGGDGGDGGGMGGMGGAGPVACVNASECSDGVFCNGAEVCDNGFCAPGVAPTCDDGLSCTTGSCDAVADACVQVLDHTVCDDGAFCNGTEVCDPVNGDAVTGCADSSGDPCIDDVSCTVDACDEATDSCTNTPTPSLCGADTFCSGTWFCDTLMVKGCITVGAADCNDGASCTADFCDPGTDACVHVKQDLECANGLFCDGNEVCDPSHASANAAGCRAGTPVTCNDGIECTSGACDEATKACIQTPNHVLCQDASACNGTEVCTVGIGCEAGTPLVCNDGLSCTQDSCSDAQGGCVYAAVHAACSDGLACNGAETCDPTSAGPGTGCKPGTPVVCPSDGITCTVEACEESGGAALCTSTPSNAACPSGQFCVVEQNGCTSGTPCNNDLECQDGNLCNGTETCTNGICAPGTAKVCNDFIGCTVDSCNPSTGECSYTPNHVACNDGLACNGVEVCDADLGCKPGAPVNCDDGVACTSDQCQEPDGSCAHFPVNSLCQDGILCNGEEQCTASGCVDGPAYVCPSDDISCTEAVCDPVLNGCVQVPDDDLCPSGESCEPLQGGCGNFCTVALCQGKVYACGDCLDNDGDGKVDSKDPSCLGPCDNNETGFKGNIPGQNAAPCKMDCYFDGDSGSGNDDCQWSHKCDPVSVAPNYPPQGSKCEYNPNSNIPGYSGTCASAFTTQSNVCLDYCGPLTPNGCDCFGCCAIPGAPTTVYLGSEYSGGDGSCSIENVGDPLLCKPCTQVPACLNTCDTCEICLGKPTLPAECSEQTCPAGVQKCGLPGQSACPAGTSCITGCCITNPQ